MRLARLLTLSPLTTPCTLTGLITCVSPGLDTRLEGPHELIVARRAWGGGPGNARWRDRSAEHQCRGPEQQHLLAGHRGPPWRGPALERLSLAIGAGP